MRHRILRHTHCIDNFAVAHEAFGILDVTRRLCLRLFYFHPRATFVVQGQTEQQHNTNHRDKSEQRVE